MARARSIAALAIAMLVFVWAARAEPAVPKSAAPVALLERAEEAVARANQAADASPSEARNLEREAAAIYRTLIGDYEIDTAAVHRNLGVLEFRLGNLGAAIASLKRAERLDPSDPRTRESLAAARRAVRTNVAAGFGDRSIDALLFWRGWVSRELLLGVGLVAWALAWILLSVRTASPRVAPVAGALVLLVAAAVSIGSLAAERWIEGGLEEGVVIDGEVTARRGPSAAIFDPAFEQPLREGVELEILERREGWIRGRLISGAECWVPAASIEQV